MPRADKKFTRKFKKLAKAKFMPFNLSRVAKSRKISAKDVNLRADFRLFASFTRLVAEIKKPKVEKEVKDKAWR